MYDFFFFKKVPQCFAPGSQPRYSTKMNKLAIAQCAKAMDVVVNILTLFYIELKLKLQGHLGRQL